MVWHKDFYLKGQDGLLSPEMQAAYDSQPRPRKIPRADCEFEVTKKAKRTRKSKAKQLKPVFKPQKEVRNSVASTEKVLLSISWKNASGMPMFFMETP